MTLANNRVLIIFILISSLRISFGQIEIRIIEDSIFINQKAIKYELCNYSSETVYIVNSTIRDVFFEVLKDKKLKTKKNFDNGLSLRFLDNNNKYSIIHDSGSLPNYIHKYFKRNTEEIKRAYKKYLKTHSYIKKYDFISSYVLASKLEKVLPKTTKIIKVPIEMESYIIDKNLTYIELFYNIDLKLNANVINFYYRKTCSEIEMNNIVTDMHISNKVKLIQGSVAPSSHR